jgi:predicted glutamine amidotransferase
MRVRPIPYFTTFRRRGKELPEGRGNPDGWGIALYPDGGKAVQLIKESIPAASSKLAKFVSTYEHLCSRTFIAHIRKASKGVVAYRNTHPFSRTVMGREYAFAHNGTVRRIRRTSTGRYKPLGATDSELLFCRILHYIEERGICGWDEEDFLEFWKFLIGINRRTTKIKKKPNKLNMLLSDGETLICYSDFYGKGALHQLMLRVRGEVPSDGSDSSPCPQDNEDAEKFIGVIATRPVNHDKRWLAMEHGELCALRGGVLVFSSAARQLSKYENSFS